MSKPLMIALRPVSYPVRIMAAILACVSLSIITSFMEYVPVAERLENTYYYPLWYSVVIIMLIHLAIAALLIIPLSFLTDAVSVSIAQRFNGTALKLVSVAAGYVLLAGASGMLFSVFMYRGDVSLYAGAIRQMVMITLMFAGWQIVLGAGFRWLRNRRRALV
ncbi:hypothetical protein [Paenibacillus silvae]|uniref:Uncharacterized protein n=1 Tax=Paenibacillus silvae TaxID=1325358 RepID=A0A2W6NB23_9BACL|nr:hypothetical protein [Paenibacillus silvae]PZT53177.1 hypothetical protein DN757_23595 [Paenibacillus silvae]